MRDRALVGVEELARLERDGVQRPLGPVSCTRSPARNGPLRSPRLSLMRGLPAVEERRDIRHRLVGEGRPQRVRGRLVEEMKFGTPIATAPAATPT